MIYYNPRTILNRFITYPFLIPLGILYPLASNKTPILDAFYSLRRLVHGPLLNSEFTLACYNDLRMILPYRDDPAFDDVWLRNVYYPYIPQKHDIVIDIGAHMGFFTLKIAQKVKKVVAIEPDPVSYEFLRINIKHNNLTKKVLPLNLGLGNSEGKMYIKRGYGYGRSRVTLNPTCVVTAVKRLDDVVGELRLEPSLLKIDVEGCEMDVLGGSIEVIKKYKPRILIETADNLLLCFKIKNFLGNNYDCFVYKVPLTLSLKYEYYLYAIPRL